MGDKLTRLLNCCCIFHQEGIEKWWFVNAEKKVKEMEGRERMEVDGERNAAGDGTFCPLHKG